MTLITWNHTCSVGVMAMDNQHGILMDAMNDLRVAADHGRGRDEINRILDRFTEFLRLHFASEEQLMENHGFPGLDSHRAEHQTILAQILQSAIRLQYGQGLEMREFLFSLREGYIEHIENFDQQYGIWLNERDIF